MTPGPLASHVFCILRSSLLDVIGHGVRLCVEGHCADECGAGCEREDERCEAHFGFGYQDDKQSE